MGTFGIDMNEVHALGGKVMDLAAEFNECKESINSIVEGITTSDYTSDDAVAIANAIKSYYPLLNEIRDRMNGFGEYGQAASNIVNQVNEEIKDKVAKPSDFRI